MTVVDWFFLFNRTFIAILVITDLLVIGITDNEIAWISLLDCYKIKAPVK